MIGHHKMLCTMVTGLNTVLRFTFYRTVWAKRRIHVKRKKREFYVLRFTNGADQPKQNDILMEFTFDFSEIEIVDANPKRIDPVYKISVLL